MGLESEPKEYRVPVRTGDIHKAIATTATALYDLLDEALMSHEPHEADEDCQFEEFAREMLRVLGSYPDQLTVPEEDAE
jgi:D-serine deaminase-like pyridoxal phosphate-dependent protein